MSRTLVAWVMPLIWTKLPETQDGKIFDGQNFQTWQYNRMKSPEKFPQIDMAGVAFRLEAIRSTTGLSKDAFARSFGLDPSSYTKMTNNLEPGKEDKTKPLKSEHAFALAARWGVTMDFIYRGDLTKIEDTLRDKIIAALTTRSE